MAGIFSSMLTRGGAQVPRLYLGAPEAEAEAVHSARMPLLDVYEDFHGIAAELEHEKFILVGRKGSGKSAFAEYVCLRSEDEPNLFAKFIRKHDYDIELLANGARESNAEFDAGAFFRWLIYTHVIKMFLKSEAAKGAPGFALLERFLDKNSGFIQIDRHAVVEQVRKYQFKVAVEPLRRLLKNEYRRDLEIKEERAHFSRLLPHLEMVIREILKSRLERDNQNAYVLFFDDLDLGYQAGNQSSKDSIIELLRAAKMVNSEVFKGTGAKVIVLLRDDIESDLVDYADSAKLFASYACRISWFQERFLREISEDEIYLKRMINRRIAKACEDARVPYMRGDPWSSLVQYNAGRKTTFRNVVECTLFRPRDLLLFFRPLVDGEYSIPLDEKSIKRLQSEYAAQLAAEVKNEMAARFSVEEIEQIFSLLKQLEKRRSYREAAGLASGLVPSVDAKVLLDYLYDRSIIGNFDDRGLYWFKCRVPRVGAKGSSLDEAAKICLQISVREYVCR